MNILIQAWSCDPYRGGEFAVSWGWIANLDRVLKQGDKIYVCSRGLREEDIVKEGLKHVELLKVKFPHIFYEIFRESSMTYILWQHYAYYAAKKLGITFDIIHVYSLSDFRKPGIWYKFKDAYTIYGPVGGGQYCPKALISYDDSSRWFREAVNEYCRYSPIFRYKIRRYSKCYACNYETAKLLPGAELLPDVPLNDKLKGLRVKWGDTKRL